jgi:hypothetical protein
VCRSIIDAAYRKGNAKAMKTVSNTILASALPCGANRPGGGLSAGWRHSDTGEPVEGEHREKRGETSLADANMKLHPGRRWQGTWLIEMIERRANEKNNSRRR